MSASAAPIVAVPTENPTPAARSTGPRTPEGKARSSRNAIKFGLFSAEAFVLEEERDRYEAICLAFLTELNPKTALEEAHTLEIIRATWRLQRCGKIEATLADSLLDGALDADAVDRKQLAVDRARAQANNALRRATAELRHLQTNREITAATGAQEAEPAEPTSLSDRKQVIAAVHLDAKTEESVRRLKRVDSLAGLLEYTDNQMTQQALTNPLRAQFVL